MCPPKQLWTTKAGNSKDEYEDASKVNYPECASLTRIAICDSASEVASSREWAQITTDAFVSRPLDLSNLDSPSLNGWLETCEQEWNEAVPWERIPWHGEAKTRAGALEMLLGLTVNSTPDGSGGLPWRAIAVGDCCLFVVCDGELETSFPMDESGQFNNTPSLICSNPTNNEDLWERVCQLSGEFQQGDEIFLASDVLAAWLLQECGSGSEPWETLLLLNTDEWEDWVEARRGERSMRNDDTTLIIIEVE